jgi:hypothetical protein
MINNAPRIAVVKMISHSLFVYHRSPIIKATGSQEISHRKKRKTKHAAERK